MSKSRRKRRGSGHGDAGDARPADALFAHRRQHLWLHFKIGLGVLVVFTVLKLWLGHGPAGHWLHLQAQQWLQSLIRHQHSETNLHLVVVDISGIKPVPFKLPKATNPLEVLTFDFTPREKIAELVDAIGEAKAAAIGVDVDFSLEPELKPDAMFSARQAVLMATAHRLSADHIPVFLGVHRNASLSPEYWLGGAEHASLAASLSRPKGVVQQMPASFQFGSHHIEGLAYALVDAYLDEKKLSLPELPPWIKWATHKISIEAPLERTPEFTAHWYHVDYAPLEHLQRISHEAVLSGTPEIKAQLANKLVILGDASTNGLAGDTAKVLGAEEPVPGVYVQACAVWTLLNPLWELRSTVGLGLAFVFSLGALLGIQWVCLHYARRFDTTSVPLTIVLTVALLAFFLFVGWRLALARILWLEVFAVCAVLVTHCLVEVFIAGVHWSRLRRGWTGVGEAFVTAPHTEQDP